MRTRTPAPWGRLLLAVLLASALGSGLPAMAEEPATGHAPATAPATAPVAVPAPAKAMESASQPSAPAETAPAVQPAPAEHAATPAAEQAPTPEAAKPAEQAPATTPAAPEVPTPEPAPAAPPAVPAAPAAPNSAVDALAACGQSFLEPILTIEFARDPAEVLCLAKAKPLDEMLSWLRFDQRCYIPAYATILAFFGLYFVSRERRLLSVLGGLALLGTLWGALADSFENQLTAELLRALPGAAATDPDVLHVTDLMWKTSLVKWDLLGAALLANSLAVLLGLRRRRLAGLAMFVGGAAMAASPHLGTSNLGSMTALGGLAVALLSLPLFLWGTLTALTTRAPKASPAEWRDPVEEARPSAPASRSAPVDQDPES